jgi:hypothetical protein
MCLHPTVQCMIFDVSKVFGRGETGGQGGRQKGVGLIVVKVCVRALCGHAFSLFGDLCVMVSSI